MLFTCYSFTYTLRMCVHIDTFLIKALKCKKKNSSHPLTSKFKVKSILKKY